MGLDHSSVPVRLGSAPVRRMRQDENAWDIACSRPPFGALLPGEELAQINRELLAELPGDLPADPSPFFDRSYQQAEYLLDPDGFRALDGWVERERSLPYRIIHGDEPFAEHAVGCQGVAWRCSTAAFLAEAAATMDALDLAAVRARFSVADMAAIGVYKVHPDTADSDAFAAITKNLRTLADWYHEIADRGLDLVIIVD